MTSRAYWARRKPVWNSISSVKCSEADCWSAISGHTKTWAGTKRRFQPNYLHATRVCIVYLDSSPAYPRD